MTPRPEGAKAEDIPAPILDLPSPNHGPRRGVAAPNMVILHYTEMGSAALALARLCNPQAEVSAHYLIDESGQIFRLVSEARRAWHAGVAAWGAVEDVNSHSIGIELSHPGHEGGLPPYPEAQMQALERLLFQVRLRWAIPPERVLGHSDVAVGRKIDPGERFDWPRLAARGHAVSSCAETPEGLAAMLPPETSITLNALKLGYRWPEGEAGFAALIRALQMRLAPDETGRPPSLRLAARAADLAARWPVATGDRPPPGPDPDYDLDTE